MKKNIYFLLVVFSLVNSINAQTTKMLGVTVGTTSALGKFGDTEDSTTGYARGGLCYAIDYDFITAKNWGGFIGITNQSFGFDADKYTESDDPDFPRTSYAWTRYNLKSLNFGASYIFNKNNKISIMPKIGTGFSILRNMDVDAEYIYLGNTFDVNQFSEASLFTNINLGLDMNFRKSMESQLGYFVKLNFQSGSTEITRTEKVKVNGQLIDQSTSKFDRSISTYSFSIGVKYIFKNKNL
jgi:hypothetical protein